MTLDFQKIRENVYQRHQPYQNLIPATVSYQTQGYILLIGPEDSARLASALLSNQYKVTILATEAITNQDQAHLQQAMDVSQHCQVYYGKLNSVKGFLGQFQVSVNQQQQDIELARVAIRQPHFDLIIDLSRQPILQQDLLPAGYFYVGAQQSTLQQVVQDLPDFIGDFEKPRYAKINPQLCAHSNNDLIGCQRCLEVCPAEAISSVDFRIEIDPYLCHGSGSCASVCPTSAIEYDLPPPMPLQTYIQNVVADYIQHTKIKPVLLFHAQQHQSATLTKQLPSHILPIAVEEIGVVGAEHCLAAIAWGAARVLIVNSEAEMVSVTEALQRQVNLVNELLLNLSLNNCIEVIDSNALCNDNNIANLAAYVYQDEVINALAIADFGADNKRQLFFAALDHINHQTLQLERVIEVKHSSFGTITVDNDCTLCMACVSACPTSALVAGNDTPSLSIVEQNCVQCGLCQQSCPEKVINLQGQINLQHQQRRQAQLLQQEPAFHCISCGKPFATESMVKRMLTMLSEHDAFKGQSQRLKMCGDCRVRDMVKDVIDDPNKQLR
ncbi:4Fe-4S binding protein [Thalassotalea sp. HSM 43]|uniref:4Fe-4S binding protein n=1 Tax=Thalassotalea sp. HSM 43 TaxID=2552945 RepID=UPI001671E343|nr:4Fe-4S binding protein [Thalassotalea sp. HSM 43]